MLNATVMDNTLLFRQSCATSMPHLIWRCNFSMPIEIVAVSLDNFTLPNFQDMCIQNHPSSFFIITGILLSRLYSFFGHILFISF